MGRKKASNEVPAGSVVSRRLRQAGPKRWCSKRAVKLAVLSEIADTAAAVTDDARRAVRSAQAERRNLQS